MKIISLASAHSSQIHLDILKKGGIIIYPSSNCYGICCDIFNETAVNRISLIKNRKIRKPYTILVRDKKHFTEYGQHNSLVDYYLKTYPYLLFTFVVPRSSKIPESFNAGYPTIAIMLAQGIERDLFYTYPNALVNTSANKAKMNNCFDVEQICIQLSNTLEYIDLIIDGGTLPPAPSSTIIKISNNHHKILRGGLNNGD